MSAGDCEQDLPPTVSFLFPNPQIEFFKVYTIKTIALAIESWSSALSLKSAQFLPQIN